MARRKIRSLTGDMVDAELAWIRLLLKDWGAWHHETHSLPARARLRTPKDGGGSDEFSLELTHRAMLHLRETSHRLYDIIRLTHEPAGYSINQLVDKHGERLGAKTRQRWSELQRMGESKAASYRRGLLEAISMLDECNGQS